MKKIIIAGGSGFIGRILAKHFEGKYRIVVLSRNEHRNDQNIKYARWDGKQIGQWATELDGAEALINLTGKSVDCRYNDRNKLEIYSSRLNSVNVLSEAVQKCKNPPKVWIQAASATIYKHSESDPMDEYSGEYGEGFSVDVCRRWEGIFKKQKLPQTRKVLLRIAIVLDSKDGAFYPIKSLVKFGFGGKQGNGNQMFSWIHQRDLCAIIERAIYDRSMSGVYNISAPHPLRNSELMKKIRLKMNMPIGIDLPKWLLKIGAVLIRTETELILKSRYIIPQRLLDSDYKFQYERLDEALEALLVSERRSKSGKLKFT